MKVTKNFKLAEFMHPTIYKLLGKLSARLIDPKIYAITQRLRDNLGMPITINTWHYGGNLKNRGLRLPLSRVGAWRSQHKVGNAVDFNVVGMTSTQVVDFILEREKEFMDLGLTRIENPLKTPGWIHLDTKKTGLNYIYIFNP